MTNYNQFTQGYSTQSRQGGGGLPQYVGPQAVFQPGFAGTDVQHVVRENSQAAANQFVRSGGLQQQGFQGGQQGFQQAGVQAQGYQPLFSQSTVSRQGGGGLPQYVGPQAVFQPGFAGTDVQHVLFENAQAASNQFVRSGGLQQQGFQGGFQQAGVQPLGYQPLFNQSTVSRQGGGGLPQFVGPQAVFQPGFAGTDVQHVLFENAQAASNPFGRSAGFQQVGFQQGFNQPFGVSYSQIVEPQLFNQQGFNSASFQPVFQAIQPNQNQFVGYIQ